MRFIACLVIALLSATVATAQDGFFSGQAIEAGAFRAKYEQAQAEIQVKDRLIADLRGVIETMKARCPCCEAGECQCKAKEAAPPSPWSITMETIDNCEACKWLDDNARPVYERNRWQWKTVKHDQPHPGVIYPRITVCNGQACYVLPMMKWVSEFDGLMWQSIQELSGFGGNWTSFDAMRNKIPQHDKRGRFLGNW